jgi:hypothetical protein
MRCHWLSSRQKKKKVVKGAGMKLAPVATKSAQDKQNGTEPLRYAMHNNLITDRLILENHGSTIYA